MQTFAQALVSLAAIAVVIFVTVYIHEHVTCWHIPYITSNCVVSK